MKRLFEIFCCIFVLCLSTNTLSANPLRLVTTTSTENSGLADYLVTAFSEQTGIQVHVVAVGTGKAIAIAKNGDADAILVHSEKDELEFIEQGYGVMRHPVMYNDFIVVGPQSLNNPVTVKDAFKAIAESENIFISRGDNSGTHKKEITIWQRSDVKPQGNWYRETGQGMGKSLQIANELQAYILTDRGTWLAQNENQPLSLEVVFERDELLFNPYSVIAVNPEKFSHVNFDAAQTWIDWLISPAAQKLIGEFKIGEQQLFFPDSD